MKTYQETKANGFVWKGRDIDNLKTEQLYSNSDFVLAFLYRSDLGSEEKDDQGKVISKTDEEKEEEIKKYFDDYETVL